MMMMLNYGIKIWKILMLNGYNWPKKISTKLKLNIKKLKTKDFTVTL